MRRRMIAIMVCMSMGMSANAADAPQSLGSLETLQAMSASEPDSKGSDPKALNLRQEALREAALGVGARGGLRYRMGIISHALERGARQLDLIYDFSPLMIQGRVIPAVLEESRDVFTQGDSRVVRLSGVAYKVVSQARFASRPPQWRQYLLVDVSTARQPSAALLPRNKEEQAIWRDAVAEGWKQGVVQANQMLQDGLNRLNRDYTGMVRYHILALKNMVTMPIVAESNMPITGSGDSMALDETLLRITELPSFNRNMSGWAPLGADEGATTRIPEGE